jgi:mannose/fructose/N-acetylgalactosamine-specific phosphotransferase system component IIB
MTIIKDTADNQTEIKNLIPDGIGLNFKNIRQIIYREHNTDISEDDPILLVVTICNTFLNEIEKSQKAQQLAISKIMADQTSQYIEDVKKTTESLGEVLKNASVEAIKDIFNHHVDALKEHKVNMKWCSLIIGISALINVIVYIIK